MELIHSTLVRSLEPSKLVFVLVDHPQLQLRARQQPGRSHRHHRLRYRHSQPLGTERRHGCPRRYRCRRGKDLRDFAGEGLLICLTLLTPTISEDVHLHTCGLIGSFDVFDSRDVVSVHTNIPYYLDSAVILFFRRLLPLSLLPNAASAIDRYHLPMYPEKKKSWSCAVKQVVVDVLKRSMRWG